MEDNLAEVRDPFVIEFEGWGWGGLGHTMSAGGAEL